MAPYKFPVHVGDHYMSFLQRSSVKLYFEDSNGDGPSVTLINGYTRPGSDFRALTRRLQSAGYRTLTLDNRGSGQTRHEGAFQLEDMAGDVAALWEEQNIAQSHVVGFSMGGLIAQSLASAHPDRCSSLCLVSSTTGEAEHFIGPRGDWSADITEVSERLSAYFSPDFAARNQALVTAMARGIADRASKPELASGGPQQSAAIRDWVARRPDTPINVPCHILHGAEDRIVAPAAAAALAERYPHASVQIWEGVGHLPLAECLNDLVSALTSFWQR